MFLCFSDSIDCIYCIFGEGMFGWFIVVKICLEFISRFCDADDGWVFNYYRYCEIYFGICWCSIV